MYVGNFYHVLELTTLPQIQEEQEMWKMRGWEIETSHPKHLSEGNRVRCETQETPSLILTTFYAALGPCYTLYYLV